MKSLQFLALIWILSLSACQQEDISTPAARQKQLLARTWQVNNVTGSGNFQFKGDAIISFERNGLFEISSPYFLPRISNGAHHQILLPAKGRWQVNEQNPEEILLFTDSQELYFIASLQDEKTLILRYDAAEPRPNDIFEATLVMNVVP